MAFREDAPTGETSDSGTTVLSLQVVEGERGRLRQLLLDHPRAAAGILAAALSGGALQMDGEGDEIRFSLPASALEVVEAAA